MQRRAFTRVLIVILASLLLAGCGGATGRRVFLQDQGVRVSLRLPSGWVTLNRSQDFAAFSTWEKVGNSGLVEILDSEGNDLAFWVKRHVERERNGQNDTLSIWSPKARQRYIRKLSSRRSRKIDGFPAEEIVAQSAVEKRIILYAESRDQIVRVIFSCEPEKWKASEPLFRASLDSLRIK